MTTSSFKRILDAQFAEGKHLCVGIDPVIEKMPSRYKEQGGVSEWLLEFGKSCVNQTHTCAAAYKPNIAFFVKHDKPQSPYGTTALWRICAYIKKHHRKIPIILDTKDADIGNTNHGYVRRALGLAHAVTLNPYLGEEALRPFLDSDLTCIMLARTSNKGADEFQNRLTQVTESELDLFGESAVRLGDPEGTGWYFMPHYQVVSGRISHFWKSREMRGIVAGATAPDELGQILDVTKRSTLALIPGIGTQGGDLEAVMRQLGRLDHKKFLINSSSGIIFADDPKAAAQELDGQIRQLMMLSE